MLFSINSSEADKFLFDQHWMEPHWKLNDHGRWPIVREMFYKINEKENICAELTEKLFIIVKSETILMNFDVRCTAW